jgi:hypothetical protein
LQEEETSLWRLQPKELMETVVLLLLPETLKSELGAKAEEQEGEMASWEGFGRLYKLDFGRRDG